jgi:hypothetical protein
MAISQSSEQSRTTGSCDRRKSRELSVGRWIAPTGDFCSFFTRDILTGHARSSTASRSMAHPIWFTLWPMPALGF